tara:strand:- start:1156 stop:1761 length:606 start_codon:yes stop_codon:yes gene_type:complete
MVKLELPPIETEHHSKILLTIGTGTDYASEIARKINIKQPTVKKHLKKLQECDYISETKNTKKVKNRKFYKINWRRITSEYLTYLSNTTKTKFKQVRKNVRFNPYLQALLMKAFNDHAKYKDKENLKTIKKIFEKVTMQLIYHLPPHKDIDLIEKSKSNSELSRFLSFTEDVESKVAADFKDTIEEFYEDIKNNNINFQKK